MCQVLVTCPVVVLGYKTWHHLGAVIEQRLSLSSHPLYSMPPVLNRSNSRRFVTPHGDEVTRPHCGVLTIDSLGMPYLSGQEVRFFDRVVSC